MPTSKRRKRAVARKQAAHRKHLEEIRSAKPAAELTPAQAREANLQSALMNMRQLYDQATQEKQGLQALIAQRDHLLAALAVEHEPLFVSRETEEMIRTKMVAGYEMTVFSEEEDEELAYGLTPVWTEEEDLDDAE